MMRVLLTLSAFLFFAVSACNKYGDKLQFGNMDLYFSGDIKSENKTIIATNLDDIGFDKSSERKKVQFVKVGDTYQFRVVVNKGEENDDNYIAQCKKYAEDISSISLINAPVELYFCDDDFKTIRSFPQN